MPAGDKLHPVSVKKVALRELPYTSDNIMSRPAENSPSAKEMGSTTDSVKILGTKRQQPDCPSSSSSHQLHVNKGVNGHLVYVRRKLETERGKKNTSNTVSSLSSSILSRKPDNEEKNEAKVQEDKTKKCNEISHSHQKTINNGLESTVSGVTTQILAPGDPKRSSDQDCNAPTDPPIPSNQDSNAPVDPQKNSSQDCQAPADIPSHIPNNQNLCTPVHPQRPSNQDLNAPVDPQRPRNQALNALVGSQRPTNQDSEAPIDPQRTSKQDLYAPVDPQRPSSQDLNAVVVPRRLSNQDCKAPSAPQKLRNEDSNASAGPLRPSNPDCNDPVDLQGPSNRDGKSLVDPHRPSNKDCKAPAGPLRLINQDSNASVGPQRPSNQDSNVPVDHQRWSNQDCKAPADPHRPSNEDWKERYLQLQAFLKNCDQSSQEDYKRMLRSLTAAGRSRLALELEKRALNLLLEEGKELHRMQVLNVIGEASLKEHASPSTRTSADQSQFQRMETMHKSPFLRNGY